MDKLINCDFLSFCAFYRLTYRYILKVNEPNLICLIIRLTNFLSYLLKHCNVERIIPFNLQAATITCAVPCAKTKVKETKRHLHLTAIALNHRPLTLVPLTVITTIIITTMPTTRTSI